MNKQERKPQKSRPNPKFAKPNTGPIGDDRFRNDPEGPGRERVRKEAREHTARVAQTRFRPISPVPLWFHRDAPRWAPPL